MIQVTMIFNKFRLVMLTYWKNFKEKYYTENEFFSLQFLFTWLFYKVLGIFHLHIFLKILFSIIVFFVLFYYWEPLLGWLLNTMVFQYYVFSVMYFINIVYFWKLVVPLLFFLIVFSYSFYNYHSIFIESLDLFLLLPSLNVFFIFLTSVFFVYKLCKKVVYVAFQRSFMWELKVPSVFDWLIFIDMLNCYFEERLVIKNKITLFKLEKKSFLYYPIAISYFHYLSDFNKVNFLEMMAEKFQSEESDEEIAKIYNQMTTDRRFKLQACLGDLHEMNDLFFSNIGKALLFAFLLSFGLLNLETLFYLPSFLMEQ